MIFIKNTQRKFKIDISYITKVIEAILELLKYNDFDINLWFTNNKTIRIFNRDYRHKDKATDIISFPFYDVQAGQKIKVAYPEEKILGDLILSVEYVQKEAQKLNLSLEQQMTKLFVHGICHLLGYDHIKDEDWIKMRAKEGWILKKLRDQKLL